MTMRTGEENMGSFVEMWGYLKNNKKYWLLPVFIILFLLGVLIVFSESSALAPLVYTLF